MKDALKGPILIPRGKSSILVAMAMGKNNLARNLYCDLFTDCKINELAGRFSRGHVAEPLGKEKNRWCREKLSGEENGNLHCKLSTISDCRNSLFSQQFPELKEDGDFPVTVVMAIDIQGYFDLFIFLKSTYIEDRK
ncbi:hypothetical protein OIU85_018913 [Salix viminalis]|uniref:Uncharacterized protein n=1 Tax=Salix viminalis TaxID=40686 RepID=A0A9Q0UVG9_SALVM|nr:hypothetical protein OIU85_018913 [Salix viminalis]